MTSDHQNATPCVLNLAQSGANVSTLKRPRAGRAKGRIDMKHRRWIDQVLAESQSPSVILPWTRAAEDKADDAGPKSSQDAT